MKDRRATYLGTHHREDGKEQAEQDDDANKDGGDYSDDLFVFAPEVDDHGLATSPTFREARPRNAPDLPNYRVRIAADPVGWHRARMCLMSVLPISGGSVAAVVAHPDDETFGLGALLANLAREGREVRVLCFTHGEASTIGANEGLAEVRRGELIDATAVLGVAEVTLLDLPDGRLDAVPDAQLDACIDRWLTNNVATFVVFEPQGVTGHPDHRAVSRAVERVADRRGLPVVEWGIDPLTASRLEAEHGLTFESIGDGPGVHDVRVDRTAQLAAIGHHTSQLDDDPVVCKVLTLLGDTERVRIRGPRESAAGGTEGGS